MREQGQHRNLHGVVGRGGCVPEPPSGHEEDGTWEILAVREINTWLRLSPAFPAVRLSTMFFEYSMKAKSILPSFSFSVRVLCVIGYVL